MSSSSEFVLRSPDRGTAVLVARLLILAVAVFAVSVLLPGGLIGVGLTLRPDGAPTTALCLLLGAAGAWSVLRGRDGIPAALCGTAVLLTVLGEQIVMHRFRDPAAHADMALATMAGFLLLAVSLVSPWLARRRGQGVAVLADVLGLCLPTLRLSGAPFASDALRHDPVLGAMSPSTALCLLCLCAALLLLRSGTGWASALSGREPGGAGVRRLAPVIVLLPILLGGLGLFATRAGLLDTDLRLILLTVSMTALAAGAMLHVTALAEAAERRAFSLETRLVAAETARDRSEMAAARAQRTETLGRLALEVAHDFNNTLSVILANLELMDGAALSASDRLHRDEALAATTQGAHLTRQLLTFGRESRLRPRAVVLDDHIPETLGMFSRLHGKGIAVGTDLALTDSLVLVDVAGFQQALLNLLLNARDAMPGGGSIRVATRVGPAPAATCGEALAMHVRVSVTDTGKGMDEATLERATDPFFTTKEAGAGSGLGLAMVSSFCRRSNGALTLSSAPAKGTEVAMLFPVHDLEGGEDGDRAE
ncbi:sensor histidine kinase [Oceaniglobus roseus]|uniref:sensor histidine kinase n=1 Tax=Oceaniglobus roseus TaxID=1737570 RepID=UPI0013000255|nr:ATP-binding protein [Kandeliimicrobium roseum]